MENGIQIIPATLTDLPAFVKLFESYREYYGQTPDRLGALQFLTERLRQKDSVIFLAHFNDRLVGFTQLYPLHSSLRMRKIWLLNDVFVLPEFRGMTIGRQLIDHCKAYARKTRSMGLMLEAEKTNEQGNKLYQRTGFVLDTAHNYYFWKNM
ncbi:MAG: GNAT family N-acetyltransferase [Lewinellaceae bacterium]|nr:GNAT family N-acetyltransferase [Lewinellaceae bacterium]